MIRASLCSALLAVTIFAGSESHGFAKEKTYANAAYGSRLPYRRPGQFEQTKRDMVIAGTLSSRYALPAGGTR
ncbi:MAG: hypothetical protein DMF59_12410 [Acidobacteria bacterium]|nr:MAG: hypothetical protein DMF59_12410 [Acidobacteriota bacterium]